MRRKVIALLMTVVISACMVACGSKEGIAAGAETGESEEELQMAEGEQTDQADTEQKSAGTENETVADAKEETKSAIEQAQAERNAATIKDVEIEGKELPDNEALSFVASMKAGWNLGNTLEAYNSSVSPEKELSTEEVWGNPVTTQAMIDEVKKAGFETIRIPITWRGHVTVAEDGTVTVSDVWLTRVKEVVDYAYNNDMYVIINTHHDIEIADESVEGKNLGYYPSTDNYERSAVYLTAIWTAMAETFKDYDEHLIFESLNEPRLAGSSYEWNFRPGVAECNGAADCINRLNQLFVDTVRATGGNNAERYLMLPGYAASLDGAATDLYQLPTDEAENKLIVSVHAYTPYNFALQAPGEGGSTDEFSIDKSTSTADINTLMKKLYDKYTSKGIPVVIGEYGARDKNNNLQDRLDYHVYYVASARAVGITCCVWDNNAFSGSGENFGLFRRRVCNWLYPEIVEAIMKYA